MGRIFDYTVGLAIVMWHLVRMSARGEMDELA